MATIAWIGLGNMGSRMSAHLVTSGNEVRGFDVVSEFRDRAAEHGVQPAASIAESVKGAEVVVLSLPNGKVVREVLEGADGVFDNAAPGTLIIDTSTVDIETSQWCHEESAARGFRFVDSPVSGGLHGAAAATLTVMLGGKPADVDAAKAVISPIGGNVFVAGEATHGVAAKLVNNMMLMIGILAASEGSQLAKEFGLDAKVFHEIAKVSSGDSWAMRSWYPVPGIVDSAPANDNFASFFSAVLARKDVGLAVEGAQKHGVNVPAATLARDQFQRLIDDGLGDKDCTLIVREASADGKVEGWDGK